MDGTPDYPECSLRPYPLDSLRYLEYGQTQMCPSREPHQGLMSMVSVTILGLLRWELRTAGLSSSDNIKYVEICWLCLNDASHYMSLYRCCLQGLKKRRLRSIRLPDIVSYWLTALPQDFSVCRPQRNCYHTTGSRDRDDRGIINKSKTWPLHGYEKYRAIA